jgi:hypothetical protein
MVVDYGQRSIHAHILQNVRIAGSKHANTKVRRRYSTLKELLLVLTLCFSPFTARAVPTITIAGFTQSAINAALASCRASNGCKLVAPAGTYSGVAIFADSSLSAGFELAGAGKGQTIFVAPAPQSAAVVQIGCNAPNGFYLHDFTVDGNRANQPTNVNRNVNGIEIGCPSDVVGASHGIVENVESRGIWTASTTQTATGFVVTNCDGCEIRNSVAHHIGCSSLVPCPGYSQFEQGMGISCLNARCIHANFHDNEVFLTSKMAIEAYDGNQVNHETVSYPTFKNNYAHDIGLAGIGINAADHATISNNRVERVGSAESNGNNGVGVFATGISHDFTVISNHVQDVMGPCVELLGNGSNVVKGNLCQNPCTNPAQYGNAAFQYGSIQAQGGTFASSWNVAVRGSGKGCVYGLLVQYATGATTIDHDHFEAGTAGRGAAPGQGVVLEQVAAGASMTSTYVDGGSGNGFVFVEGAVNMHIGATNTIYHPNGALASGRLASGTWPPTTVKSPVVPAQ